ncbi:hypothetical protein PAESOLCIP111_00331 [Paenibacillus solanacearum]|uniref:DUF2087 domain-containing protein n=1 Tax=Paenibacillus solanacearum TaxID=2048548 RepID=A0A916NUR1_9BACL|nr:DUF2087 domain-containing protein [Paenibacillus solanacearum]CAG7599689.1 hypothetical protein PAESOLCIP111_00331 [Paenibacillus solanacearum]
MSNHPANTQTKNEKLQKSVLRHFFTEQGRLKNLPAQLKKKLIVLEHLTNQLEPKKAYSEQEMNEFIKFYHEDYATIRRELFIHRFVNRNNEIYEVNAPGEWRDWVSLK